MKQDFEPVYRQMVRIRVFEEALASLWRLGLISGELHLGLGEEALIAGVLAHSRDGDALTVDHRSTPGFVARDVGLEAMVLEMLGSGKGLCGGMGGHMHLFSPEHLAASSGIVGSSVPLGAGFALAAKHLSPGSVAVAFLGEGAMNQGMVFEALNLASVWKLPLIVVCKDNGWAITTRSRSVTSGSLVARARSLGVTALKVNGLRADRVWHCSRAAFSRARHGGGPCFIHARCAHLEGHFLGDPLLRVYKDPAGQLKEITAPLTRAAFSSGGGICSKAAALARIARSLSVIGLDTYMPHHDPLKTAAWLVTDEARERIWSEVRAEVDGAVERALVQAGAESEVMPRG
ncbi:MAG: thiamine pyrophosphate-dependent dehydrogenase E1 component subunit alpha [Candidatus Geothermincolia bacterium]